MTENLEPRDDYPRISVDSLNDWYRLKNTFNDAALLALDAKLEGQGMANYRDTFCLHIKQFVSETFETVVPNVRVNGRNLEEYHDNQDEAEQFDESLDRRVWSLSDQRRRWDLEIATKRRTTPQEVERLLRELVTFQNEYDNSNIFDYDSNMYMDQENRESDDREIVLRELLSLMSKLDVNISKQLERSSRMKFTDEDVKHTLNANSGFSREKLY